jgi:hypothetical protein
MSAFLKRSVCSSARGHNNFAAGSTDCYRFPRRLQLYHSKCTSRANRRPLRQPAAAPEEAAPLVHSAPAGPPPSSPLSQSPPPAAAHAHWSDMVARAAQLDYPQFPDSCIRVKDCTEGFMRYLVGVSEARQADPALYASNESLTMLASAPPELSSLVVHPSTPLSQAAQLTITQILTSQIPDIPAPHLLAMFALGEDGKSVVRRCSEALAQQDRALGGGLQPLDLAPLRHQTLQWLSTRRHFPIRTAVQPYDVAEVGPQVVWALVWLHHHVMGALRAWGEGRLTTRQLVDIYSEAAR